MDRLSVPQGDFDLARYPVRKGETLRAWDAADEYLLAHLAETETDLTGTVVIANDEFGALSTALSEHQPILWSDSYLSHLGVAANLRRNRLDEGAVVALSSLAELPDPIDVLILKVPKSLALLEDQLRRVVPHLHDGSTVIAAGMVKHIHNSTLELFAKVVGPTTTSLAQKKARLIFCQIGVEPTSTPDDADDETAAAAAPVQWPRTWELAAGITVTNHAAVFSPERLDIGTRFLLDNLPKGTARGNVIDLGCGNGVIGLIAAMADPDTHVTFIDESYMAVASAEATFRANLGPEREARFVVGDGINQLSDGPPVEAGSVDVIINNPPFHVNHAVGDAVAWQMFVESHAALAPGGELWVVGNRHLAYHAKLTRIFGNCKVSASNAKFVLFRAIKSEVVGASAPEAESDDFD